MLSRELTNSVFTNVAIGVSLTCSHWCKTPQYSPPVFLLRLGKCEITQTGLGKCEFAQKNCLSLPKTANNLPKCSQKFAPNNKNFAQMQAKVRPNFT